LRKEKDYFEERYKRANYDVGMKMMDEFNQKQL